MAPVIMVNQSKSITRELDRNADSQDLLHTYQIRNTGEDSEFCILNPHPRRSSFIIKSKKHCLLSSTFMKNGVINQP